MKKTHIFLLLLFFFACSPSVQKIDELLTKAKSGDIEAQLDLGYMYYYGKEVPKDYTKAFYYFEKAASKGSTKAQLLLGHKYLLGEIVPRDYHKAAFYFKKAAAKGEGNAQFGLGYLYNKGLGVQKDQSLAFSYYKKAAMNGVRAAPLQVGFMYWDGKAVPRSYIDSYKWFLIAEKMGDGKALKYIEIITKKMTFLQIDGAHRQADILWPKVNRFD